MPANGTVLLFLLTIIKIILIRRQHITRERRLRRAALARLARRCSKEIPLIWKAAFVRPLLKGRDPATLNNYRPVSNLSVLAKILEALVANQLKEFLYENNIFSSYQSGFRKKHSTVTAALKVVNDISVALDKQHCASLFLDLSKAFDTVDHSVLKLRLLNSGLSEQAVAWFSNYLNDRSQ